MGEITDKTKVSFAVLLALVTSIGGSAFSYGKWVQTATIVDERAKDHEERLRSTRTDVDTLKGQIPLILAGNAEIRAAIEALAREVREHR